MTAPELRIPAEPGLVHAWLYHGANHLGEGGEACEAHDVWSDQKHCVDPDRWKAYLISMDAYPEPELRTPDEVLQRAIKDGFVDEEKLKAINLKAEVKF